jgi:hypothetical protein
VNILLQVGPAKEPELADVPLLSDLVTNPADRQISDLITVPTGIGSAYWVAPGVPAERLAILRAALAASAKDPDLLAEAQKTRMLIRPRAGADIQAEVARVAETPPAVVQRMLSMVEPKK